MNLFSHLKKQFSHFSIRGKIVTVLWITLLWTVIGMLRFFEGYTNVITTECLKQTIALGDGILASLLAIIPAGILIGSSLVFLWERWLRKMVLPKAIFFILLFYTFVFFSIYPIEYLIQVTYNPNLLINNNITETILHRIFKISVIPTYLFWLAVTILTIFILLIRDTFGPIHFVNFLKGKYLRPKREERIFMFMDLKASTTIAEKLGEEQYFNFLNDTFSIATPGILLTKGEIYQYVGDEIVISWSTKKGLQNANCIRCYLEMVALLKAKAEYFDKKYAIQPKFKAGLHYGNVIAGEMGIVKREIVYSGDVLNTASRIQSLCNEMGTNVLLSKNLVERMDLHFLEQKTKSVGDITLRGKKEKVALVALTS